MEQSQPKESAPSFEDKIYAALAYPFWYLLVPFWWAFPEQRKKSFLRHHCLHALLANLVFWLAEVLLTTVGQLIGQLPIIGMLSILLSMVLGGVILVRSLFVLYGIFMALSGKFMDIQYLTAYIEQNTPSSEA